jgi:putative addiction module component (TIGR02574 family)
MTDHARKLHQDALELPRPERAELAADLLASLDDEPEEDVEAAWAAEIERRVQHARENPQEGVSWETVRAEMYADLSR